MSVKIYIKIRYQSILCIIVALKILAIHSTLSKISVSVRLFDCRGRKKLFS